MARNETIVVNQDSWTQLTNADVTTATWQTTGPADVYIMGAASAVAPVASVDGLIYEVLQGELGRTLADVFSGITPVRLYAKSTNGNSKVFISHA